MNLSKTSIVLDMINSARGHGIDVTTEVYPYTAWSVGLNEPLFEPGWKQRYEIDYGDLTLATTGEVLTADTFEKYRAQGVNVVGKGIPKEAVEVALARDGVMIVSDAKELRHHAGRPAVHCRGGLRTNPIRRIRGSADPGRAQLDRRAEAIGTDAVRWVAGFSSRNGMTICAGLAEWRWRER